MLHFSLHQSDLNAFANLHPNKNSNAYRTVINEKDIKFDVCEALKSIPRCIPSRLHHQMSHLFFVFNKLRAGENYKFMNVLISPPLISVCDKSFSIPFRI